MVFKNIDRAIRPTFYFLLILLFLASCGGKQAVKTIFQKRTPYEAYEHSLREAKLDRTALGQAWLQAGQRALHDSVRVTLPFQETAYFRSDKPTAGSYSFLARQGELIDIKVTTRTQQDIKLFIDLFELSNEMPHETKHVAAADTTSLNLEYRVDDDLVHLVRVQPELLKSGSYTITIVTRPSLSFPVKGKDSRAIQSYWGAERDAGARRHEGVDIFAPRGTPVLAGAKGIITRVNTTPIGGKVVWLSDLSEGQNLYYAHLDSQLVQPGQQVNTGDTLGLIGNTGSAKTTVPHLHFGIYSYGRGAVDPFPFINDIRQKPTPVQVSEDQLGKWGRTAKNNITLRLTPHAKAPVVTTLAKNTALQITGGSGNWYRVQLPNGLVGYLPENNLESITKPLRTEILKIDQEIIELPDAQAPPIALVKKDTTLAVVAVYQVYQLVKLSDGTYGWLLNNQA
jgi:peptidoglycan LD-endopeptidase LytH